MKKAILIVITMIGAASASADPLTPAGYPDGWRLKATQSYTAQAAELKEVTLLFLGASIIRGWTHQPGLPVWEEAFKAYSKVNFGLAGDRIENVLWRITEGKQLDGFTVKLVVLSVGTNNLYRNKVTGGPKNTPEEIAAGMKHLIAVIREKQPEAKILLVGLYSHLEINRVFAGCADGKSVFFLDVSQAFLGEDGKVKPGLLRDGVHPAQAGYQILASRMVPEIEKILNGNH